MLMAMLFVLWWKEEEDAEGGKSRRVRRRREETEIIDLLVVVVVVVVVVEAVKYREGVEEGLDRWLKDDGKTRRSSLLFELLLQLVDLGLDLLREVVRGES